MKKITLFLVLLGFVFGGGYFLGRTNPFARKNSSNLASSLHYKPATYSLIDRPITLVVIGKNNGAFLEKTLRSIFSQKYDNYKVIYIDDASTDGSGSLAEGLIYESSAISRVTFVQNEKSLGFLANLVRAVETCSDDEIVAVLHGEDLLAHEWVLERINHYYQDPDLWLTFGTSVEYPSFKRGETPALVKGDMLRKEPTLALHLETFYAGLFKRIKETDLLYHGAYFPEAERLAYMAPMLEMAEGHFTYVPDVLSLSASRERGNFELQAECLKEIKGLSTYAPLERPPFFSPNPGEE